jgi:DNA-binding NarL/FixJ family response regulator
MKTSKIRILCVDDHAFLVEGLRARFATEHDLECVGRLPTADALVPEIKRLQPDIVLLDIEMPGTDAFEAARDVKRVYPDVKVIFFSAYVKDHYVSAAFKAGAWGYFSKSDDTDAIVQGLRKVAAGEFAFGPKVAERVQPAKGGRRPTAAAAPPSKLDALTAREQEVLRLIGRGLSRTEIADILCRSPKTVDGHREKIMQKLDIHDRGELVHFAIREGLVEA